MNQEKVKTLNSSIMSKNNKKNIEPSLPMLKESGVSTQFLADGIYVIKTQQKLLKLASKETFNVLMIEEGTLVDGSNVIVSRYKGQKYQQWFVEHIPNSHNDYLISSVVDRNYVLGYCSKHFQDYLRNQNLVMQNRLTEAENMKLCNDGEANFQRFIIGPWVVNVDSDGGGTFMTKGTDALEMQTHVNLNTNPSPSPENFLYRISPSARPSALNDNGTNSMTGQKIDNNGNFLGESISNLIGKHVALFFTHAQRFIRMQSGGRLTPVLKGSDEFSRFLVVDAGDGKIALRSTCHNRFIRMDLADRSHSVGKGAVCSEDESFTLDNVDNGKYSLSLVSNSSFSCPSFMHMYDNKVVALAELRDESLFEIVFHPLPGIERNPDTYALRVEDERVLSHVHNNVSFHSHPIAVANQLWDFIPVDENIPNFQNEWDIVVNENMELRSKYDIALCNLEDEKERNLVLKETFKRKEIDLKSTKSEPAASALTASSIKTEHKLNQHDGTDNALPASTKLPKAADNFALQYDELRHACYVPENRGHAEYVVKTIRDKHYELWINPDTAIVAWAEHLKRTVPQMGSELHSKRTNIIMETIQNVDDCDFKDPLPHAKITLTPTKYILSSNELGFKISNLFSICNIAASDKPLSGNKTGRKGIGFKSVYMLGDKVKLKSNFFNIEFNQINTDNVRDPLLQLVPNWVEDDHTAPSSGTELSIVVKDYITHDSLASYDWRSDFYSSFEVISYSFLLVARQLKSISCAIANDAEVGEELIDLKKLIFEKTEEKLSSTTTVTTPDICLPRIERSVVTIKATIQAAVTLFDTAILAREDGMLSSESHESDDKVINEEVTVFSQYVGFPELIPTGVKRMFDEVIKLSITIPHLTPSEFLKKFPNRFCIHATLPAEEAHLNILINADFDLNAERASLLETPRNNVLLDCCFKMIEDVFCEEAVLNSVFASNFLFFIPTIGKRGEQASMSSFLTKRLQQWKLEQSFANMIKVLTKEQKIRVWSGDAATNKVIPFEEWVRCLGNKYFILDPVLPHHKLFIDSKDALALGIEDALDVLDKNCSLIKSPRQRGLIIDWLVKTCGGKDFPRFTFELSKRVASSCLIETCSSKDNSDISCSTSSSKRGDGWRKHPLFNRHIFTCDADVKIALGVDCKYFDKVANGPLYSLFSKVSNSELQSDNDITEVTLENFTAHVIGIDAKPLEGDNFFTWIRSMTCMMILNNKWWHDFISKPHHKFPDSTDRSRGVLNFVENSFELKEVLNKFSDSSFSPCYVGSPNEYPMLLLAIEYVCESLSIGYRSSLDSSEQLVNIADIYHPEVVFLKAEDTHLDAFKQSYDEIHESMKREFEQFFVCPLEEYSDSAVKLQFDQCISTFVVAGLQIIGAKAMFPLPQCFSTSPSSFCPWIDIILNDKHHPIKNASSVKEKISKHLPFFLDQRHDVVPSSEPTSMTSSLSSLQERFDGGNQIFKLITFLGDASFSAVLTCHNAHNKDKRIDERGKNDGTKVCIHEKLYHFGNYWEIIPVLAETGVPKGNVNSICVIIKLVQDSVQQKGYPGESKKTPGDYLCVQNDFRLKDQYSVNSYYVHISEILDRTCYWYIEVTGSANEYLIRHSSNGYVLTADLNVFTGEKEKSAARDHRDKHSAYVYVEKETASNMTTWRLAETSQSLFGSWYELSSLFAFRGLNEEQITRAKRKHLYYPITVEEEVIKWDKLSAIWGNDLISKSIPRVMLDDLILSQSKQTSQRQQHQQSESDVSIVNPNPFTFPNQANGLFGEIIFHLYLSFKYSDYNPYLHWISTTRNECLQKLKEILQVSDIDITSERGIANRRRVLHELPTDQSVTPTNDSAGYDFCLSTVNKHFEVKATENKKVFYISRNELETALKLKSAYEVVLVDFSSVGIERIIKK